MFPCLPYCVNTPRKAQGHPPRRRRRLRGRRGGERGARLSVWLEKTTKGKPSSRERRREGTLSPPPSNCPRAAVTTSGGERGRHPPFGENRGGREEEEGHGGNHFGTRGERENICRTHGLSLAGRRRRGAAPLVAPRVFRIWVRFHHDGGGGGGKKVFSFSRSFLFKCGKRKGRGEAVKYLSLLLFRPPSQWRALFSLSPSLPFLPRSTQHFFLRPKSGDVDRVPTSTFFAPRCTKPI